MLKRFLLVICAFLVCSLTNVQAQFEGEIDMKITTNGEKKSREMNYTMLVKQDMVASEVKSNGDATMSGKFILRGDKKVMWIVNDEHKMYLEQSTEDIQAKVKDIKKDTLPQPKLKKTGKTETILGYSCEEWVTEGEHETTSLWCTSKLGNVYQGFSKSFSRMGGMAEKGESSNWMQEFKEKNLFPLKVVSTRGGQVRMTVEATKVEAKKVASSVFEPPAGYQKQSLNLDMNKMMQMMQEKMRQQQMKEKEDNNKKE